MKYHSDVDVKQLVPYVPYQSQQEIFELEHGEGGGDEGLDSSDYDFLKVLSGLKNNFPIE